MAVGTFYISMGSNESFIEGEVAIRDLENTSEDVRKSVYFRLLDYFPAKG